MEKIESYKRQSETSVHGTTITEDLFDFKLLKAACLTSHHKQLIKTTITEINDHSITKMIKSNFFINTENHSTKSEGSNIKAEPLLYARKLPAKDRDNEEENDSENVMSWHKLSTLVGIWREQWRQGNIITNTMVKASSGSGKKFLASSLLVKSVNFRPHRAVIKTDITYANIPLILPGSSMKKHKCHLNSTATQ